MFTVCKKILIERSFLAENIVSQQYTVKLEEANCLAFQVYVVR